MTMWHGSSSDGCYVADDTLITLRDGSRREISTLAGANTCSTPLLAEDLKVGIGQARILPAGTRETRRVRTRLGHELVASVDSSLMTFGEATPLGELGPGDVIAVARKIAVFGNKDLPSSHVEFLAFMTSGGTLQKGHYPVYGNEDPALMEAFCRAARRIGDVRLVAFEGDEYARHGVARGENTRGRPAVNHAVVFLEQHGLMGKPTRERLVPPAIFTLPAGKLALYLGRLWSSEGSANIQRSATGVPSVGVSYWSTSKAWCYQIQHLLLRFGVVGRAKYHPTSSVWRLAISEWENVRLFAETVGRFALGRRAEQLRQSVEALPEIGKGKLDVVPAAVWPLVEDARLRAGVSKQSIYSHTKVTHGRSNVTRPRLEMIANLLGDAQLGALARSDLVWDKIVDIERTGTQHTYGICAVGKRDHNRPVAAHVIV